MKKKQSNETSESNINKVLKYQENELNDIKSIDKIKLEKTIANTEKLLKSMGYSVNDNNLSLIKKKKTIVVPTWDEMCNEASKEIKDDVSIYDLFTNEELIANKDFINNLNNEFKEIYKLDNIEMAICVLAGLLSAVIELQMD